jgi:hypothetical protein
LWLEARSNGLMSAGRNVCPAGKLLTTIGNVGDGHVPCYLAFKRDCDACPLRPQCCPRMLFRKVTLDINEDARDLARASMGTPEFDKSRDERKKVEMRFAQLKTHHRFERMRLRGLSGAATSSISRQSRETSRCLRPASGGHRRIGRPHALLKRAWRPTSIKRWTPLQVTCQRTFKGLRPPQLGRIRLQSVHCACRVPVGTHTATHPPDAERLTLRTPHATGGGTRDLPGSDTILLHVMWPSTPAGCQHLAWRRRTCCFRGNEDSRPLRYLIVRGSIPHPMQSLCTLRSRCRQRSRNTRYQAGATPYLGRTLTGWIAPACAWRTYSITSSARAAAAPRLELSQRRAMAG